MATRLYFPSSGAAAVSPAYDAAWNVTGSAKRCITLTSKTATPLVNSSCGAPGSAGDNCLAAQFVSRPLAGDQTISGTIKGQIGCREATTALDARSQLVVRVVSNDGSTVRGTLLAAQAEALSSEWSTAASHVNRAFPLAALAPASLGSVNALDGDRLVIEVGAKCGGTGTTPTVRLQDDQASDLPEDETTVSGSADPWIEFSADIVFAEVVPAAAVMSGRLSVGIGLGI